jgi:hypothetical protein
MLLLQYACTSKHAEHAVLFFFFEKVRFAGGRTILEKKYIKNKNSAWGRVEEGHVIPFMLLFQYGLLFKILHNANIQHSRTHIE